VSEIIPQLCFKRGPDSSSGHTVIACEPHRHLIDTGIWALSLSVFLAGINVCLFVYVLALFLSSLPASLSLFFMSLPFLRYPFLTGDLKSELWKNLGRIGGTFAVLANLMRQVIIQVKPMF